MECWGDEKLWLLADATAAGLSGSLPGEGGGHWRGDTGSAEG